jgi:hypothetical protein
MNPSNIVPFPPQKKIYFNYLFKYIGIFFTVMK